MYIWDSPCNHIPLICHKVKGIGGHKKVLYSTFCTSLPIWHDVCQGPMAFWDQSK